MLQQHVKSFLLYGIDQQQGMVSTDQNLELTQLISRWRHPPKHEFRIGVRPRGVNLPPFDRPYGELTLGPMAALGDKVVDKRIVERNITKGLLTKERYDQHLAELPDREGTYDRVEVEPSDSSEEAQLE